MADAKGDAAGRTCSIPGFEGYYSKIRLLCFRMGPEIYTLQRRQPSIRTVDGNKVEGGRWKVASRRWKVEDKGWKVGVAKQNVGSATAIAKRLRVQRIGQK